MFNVRTFLATPFVLLSWFADWLAFHAWYIGMAIAGNEIEAESDDDTEGWGV